MRIGALLYDGVDQIDLTGPFEVLARIPGASYRTFATTTAAVRDVHGLILRPDAALTDAPQLDVLHVPGGFGQEDLMDDVAVLSWLQRQAAGARIVFSVCTGALLLGAAGLLRERRATTHWAAFHVLAQYGAIPVRARVVRDDRYVFAAGVTAGIDGALTVAALLAGDEIAQRIALALEYAPEPPFQSGTPESAPPGVLSAVRDSFAAMTARREATAGRLGPRLRCS